MAFVNLSGILTNPIGGFDVGGILKITHLTATGNTIPSTAVEIIIPPNGAYDIDLNFGVVRFDYTTEFTQNFVAITTVNGDTTATTIPELLNAVVPPTNAQLLLFQDILADAVTAETNAAASAAAAAASALNRSAESTETVPEARLLTSLPNNVAVAVVNPSDSKVKGLFYHDELDSDTPDDGGVSTIVTDGGARLKIGIKPLTADVTVGDVNNHFDDNEIIDSIYKGFTKTGIAMSTPGTIPQTVATNGTADANIGETITFGDDVIIYIKATAGATGDSRIRLGGSADSVNDVIEIAFNYDLVTDTPTLGTVSIKLFNFQPRVLYTGTQSVDMAIVLDSKFKTFYFLNRGISNFYDEIAARAVFGALNPNVTKISYITNSGADLSVDHFKVCRPNYIAIGDSLCAGEVLFDPNPVAADDDYNHQWESHANAEGINTVIVNRGVGGQRSDSIAARVQADVVDQGPRQVYLHLSTNDHRNIMGGPLTYAARTSFTQSSIDLMVNNGIQVVLLNSMYSNTDPASATYYQDYLPDSDGFRNLKDYKKFVDQMLVLRDSNTGVLDVAFTNIGDGVHLNQAGYTLFGQTVGAATFSPVETVNKINTDNKFNFPVGLQSKGVDVNTRPSGFAILEPIAGSLDYKISTTISPGAENVVLAAYRDPTFPQILHVIFNESVEPSVISTDRSATINDSGMGMYTGAVAASAGARDVSYFCMLLLTGGIPSLTTPNEAKMQTLHWMIKF